MTRGTRDSTSPYIIGVMKTPVENKTTVFDNAISEATEQIEKVLTEGTTRLRAELFEFDSPHLLPSEGTYSPFDFLRIGLTEKAERGVNFLLIVTEVDLTATTRSYVVALPSQIANIGIISVKRLSERFWGRTDQPELTARRLTAVMLHTIGHLLNLPHSPDPENVMHDVTRVESLQSMTILTPAQFGQMSGNLPRESRDQTAPNNSWGFVVSSIVTNWIRIVEVVVRANPLRLALHLPAVITAALSVAIVLFFSAEIWDVASSMALLELIIFALFSVGGATLLLNRAFTLNAGSQREGVMLESAIVMRATTILSLLLTVLVMYAGFFALTWASIVLIFPDRLMATWPTIDPATKSLDHLKVSTFVAGMGILAGSLGGGAERKNLIRHILFLDEET